MKYYKAEAYAITKVGKSEYLGNVVIEKSVSIPMLGLTGIKDAASQFQYALLEDNEQGNTIGQRADIIEQAGFDIGIYKNDINKRNIATADEVVDYGVIFPLAKISDKQDELKFALDSNIKTTRSK